MAKLELVEAVLVHCNLVNNNYQQESKVLLTFVPNKEFFFFLSGFSFTNIHDSRDSRGRGRVSI